jgi:polysaccharide chain length determinant protein (PEP-CTERM system associated)
MATKTLLERIGALKRHKITALVTFVAVLALVAPFVYGLPSLYRATATVVVEGQVPEAFVQSAVSGEIDSRLQAIKQEAMSRGRLTELVERFNLYPAMRGKVPIEVILDRLQRDIKTEIKSADQGGGRPTTIAFALTYIGRDPVTAANVANTLASFYVAQNDKMRTRQATRTTEVIRQQLADTEKRMNAAEARMRGFISQHMGSLPQQVDLNLAALERFNTQLQSNADEQSKLMERRQTLQSQIAELDTKTAVEGTATSEPEAKLLAAKRELAALQTQFRDNYPDVRNKKAEVDKLQKEVASMGTRTGNAGLQGQRTALAGALGDTETRLDKLSRDNKAIRDQMASYEGRVESAPSRVPEYTALSREYSAVRDIYDGLLKKYDEARLSESMEKGSQGQEFRVLDTALPPPFAAGPNRMRLLVLAFLGALLVAALVVLAVDHFDTSFHSVDELRAFTRVPVLVSIPLIATDRDTRRRRLRATALLAASGAALLLLAAGTFHLAHGSELLSRALLQLG